MQYDYLIVGGGIVGLSCAWQLQKRYPHASILLLEKEKEIAAHQTGHNSGVIHSGIYYQPESLKANFCRRGLIETIQFCQEHQIDYKQCGKLLVATDQLELVRMQALYQRSIENNIDCQLISTETLKDMEPWISGLGAVHIKATGIVDYREICRHMARVFTASGGTIELANPVLKIEENDKQIILHTGRGPRHADMMVCCAGLQADRLVKAHGINADFQIIPFRGEYYKLKQEFCDHIKHLIYPIPDPAMPFLGIHLTPMIDGTVTVGPNALLGFKREGYGRFNFSLADTCGMLGYAGFWRVMGANYKSGFNEIRNAYFKRAYVKQVTKYCPRLTSEDLSHHTAGIRAQAVLSDGTLIHDFLFEETKRGVHVCNAPSPAASSAIPIGNYLCDRVSAKIQNL